MTPLQTLQDQRKAEFEKKIMSPSMFGNIHWKRPLYREACLETLIDFLSETARLGYVAGLEEARKMCTEANKDYTSLPELGATDEKMHDRHLGRVEAYLEVANALSSLITTNQEMR